MLEESGGAERESPKPASRWMYLLDGTNDAINLGDGEINARVKLLMSDLQAFFEMVLPRNSFSDPCFMMSYLNAQIQQVHTDVLGILHPNHAGGAIPGLSMTYSFIISFDDNTYLYVYERNNEQPTKVKIPKYGMIIFAADLIHSGMDLPDKVDNYRFHGIIKSLEYKKGGDKQGWLIWNTETMEWQYVENCDKNETYI